MEKDFKEQFHGPPFGKNRHQMWNTINNIRKTINTVETKDLYRMLLTKKSKRPTSENKWKKNNEPDVDENDWENYLY
jgi:hypothetical protein